MKFDIQKAGLLKRFSAFLFDVIILSVLVAGIGFLLSDILNYDDYVESLQGAYDSFEEEYSVDFEITGEKYESLSKEEQDNFNNAYNALIKDEKALGNYSMVINLTLVIISISILLGYLILEFFVPLLFKNGQTFGKKIFGIGVMHTSGIKITPLLLFIRTVLGKYTLETMIPVLTVIMIFFNTVGIMGTLVLGLLLVVEVVLMIATRTNSLIHDILAKTVVIDIASQKIFENGAELLEYKKKMHLEEVNSQKY